MLDWLIIRGGVRATSLSHYLISHFTHRRSSLANAECWCASKASLSGRQDGPAGDGESGPSSGRPLQCRHQCWQPALVGM